MPEIGNTMRDLFYTCMAEFMGKQTVIIMDESVSNFLVRHNIVSEEKAGSNVACASTDDGRFLMKVKFGVEYIEMETVELCEGGPVLVDRYVHGYEGDCVEGVLTPMYVEFLETINRLLATGVIRLQAWI